MKILSLFDGISALQQQIINLDFSRFMENCKKEGFLKYLKKIGVYQTSGARQNKTTWCNSYIWVLVAMELSPLLYSIVVMWLGDKLILNRIEAGNFYKGLTHAISKFKDVDYVKLAKALNYKIFGKHETGIRNLATKEELKKLTELESRFAFAIDMKYVNSFEECIKEIEKYNI